MLALTQSDAPHRIVPSTIQRRRRHSVPVVVVVSRRHASRPCQTQPGRRSAVGAPSSHLAPLLSSHVTSRHVLHYVRSSGRPERRHRHRHLGPSPRSPQPLSSATRLLRGALTRRHVESTAGIERPRWPRLPPGQPPTQRLPSSSSQPNQQAIASTSLRLAVPEPGLHASAATSRLIPSASLPEPDACQRQCPQWLLAFLQLAHAQRHPESPRRLGLTRSPAPACSDDVPHPRSGCS